MMVSDVRHRTFVGLDSPLLLAALIVGAVLATALPVAFGVTVGALYAIASKVVLCALAAGLLWRLRLWRRAGFLSLPARHDIALIALPSLLVLAMLASVVLAGPAPMEPALVLAFALVATGVGFSEEGLFRGVLLESLRERSAASAIVGTTVAFSLIHVAGLLAGATLQATLTQVVLGGVPFGLGLAALRLTTRSIWPLVVLHALNNFTSFLMSGHWEAVSQDMSRFGIAGLLQLGLIVALFLYGGWYLWHTLRTGAVALQSASPKARP